MRLAVLASHPIQYQAPLFRAIARHLNLKVLFAHNAQGSDQASAGFGIPFEWDADLLSGYEYTFLRNISSRPGLDHFSGCDTPDIGMMLASERFDALLVMGWQLLSFLQGIYAAKRLHIPLMVRGDSQLATPRSALKRAGKTFFYPRLLRFFDAALYVGTRSREYWLHYRYPEDRMFFSPHCVDNAWFADRATVQARQQLRALHNIPEETPILLFAGKLLPFKRPLDVVYATSMLNNCGIPATMMIAGSGPLGGAIEEEAKRLRVRVVDLGFCNQTQMPSAYVAADILVLPSDGRETWGLVANEALACGRPIVVSNSCGCATDLAADGVAGSAYSTGDVTGLACVLEALLKKPPSLERIVAKISRYSTEAAADGVFAALDRMQNKQMS